MTAKEAQPFVGKIVKVILYLSADHKPIRDYGEAWLLRCIGREGTFLSFDSPRNKTDKGTVWTPQIRDIERLEEVEIMGMLSKEQKKKLRNARIAAQKEAITNEEYEKRISILGNKLNEIQAILEEMRKLV